MTPDQIVKRARSQIGLKTIYRLGGGNLDPSALTVQDELRSSDCSAFACWVFGVRKYQPRFAWLVKFNGGWLNTDGMYHDAALPVGFFERAPVAAPGMALVYPSARSVGKSNGPKIGHVAIVGSVSKSGRTLSVIHCSSGNYRDHGDAIRETGPAAFERVSYSILVSCATVAHEVKGAAA